MITTENKAKITAFFGRNYSKKILPVLQKNNVVRVSGEPYTPRTLQWLINGGAENLEAEKVIFDLMVQIKKERKKISQIKKNI